MSEVAKYLASIVHQKGFLFKRMMLDKYSGEYSGLLRKPISMFRSTGLELCRWSDLGYMRQNAPIAK
jgi:hypothetical protein